MYSIPVMKPKLPTADRLAFYLKSIDASRVYSNFGPLAVTLEDRLAEHYCLAEGNVAVVANATMGLAIALATQQPPRGSLCVMPAWTFVGSAHAAVLAGLVPYFVDVDPTTWALDAKRILEQISKTTLPVGAIMPVMPFGAPLDMAPWEAVQSQTGLAVVIDAAAAFDSLVPCAVPAVVSLHATKTLGIGEGGFVISTAGSTRREVQMRANFGFFGSRQAQAAALNAKLSEYQAAVGHAALDEWNEIRDQWYDAGNMYRRALAGSDHVRMQSGFGENWISSTCLLEFLQPDTAQVERSLATAGIETRRWWGMGAHAHPATVSYPRIPVPVTDTIARSTLAVPFYRDITAAEISQVVDVILAETSGSTCLATLAE